MNYLHAVEQHKLHLFETFGVEKYHDLENRVRGHSLTPFDIDRIFRRLLKTYQSMKDFFLSFLSLS